MSKTEKHTPVSININFDVFTRQFSHIFPRIAILDENLCTIADFFDETKTFGDEQALGNKDLISEIIQSLKPQLISFTNNSEQALQIAKPIALEKAEFTIFLTILPILKQTGEGTNLLLMISAKPLLSNYCTQKKQWLMAEYIVDRDFYLVDYEKLDQNSNKNLTKRWVPELFEPVMRDYILQSLMNFVSQEQEFSFKAILTGGKELVDVTLQKAEKSNHLKISIWSSTPGINTSNCRLPFSDLSRCLLEMGNIFSHNSNIQIAIEQSLEMIRRELRLHTLAIMQDDPASEQFTTLYTSFYHKNPEFVQIDKIPYEVAFIFKRILEKNIHLVSDSIYAGMPEVLLKHLKQIGVKTYAAVPIFIAGNFYGALVAAHLKEKHWEISEVQFLIAAAAMIGHNIDRELNRLKLQQSRDGFLNIFNSASDMVFIVSFSGEIIEANKSAATISGYPVDELIGQNINTLTTSSQDIEPAMAGEVHQSKQLITGTILVTKDGRKVPIDVREKIITYRGMRAILIVARDISERKNIDRLIVKTILETEERERKQFAETIHDDLAPLLSALKIYINLFATKKIETGTEDELITQMQQIIDQSIATAKQTAVAMMPHLLSHFGFVEAISDYIQKINKTKVINIGLSIYPENLTILPAISKILFGVVKELINNTLKHSNATKAHLELHKQKAMLRVTYKEDGRGFDVESVLRSEHSGLGLKNLVNKIDSLAGQISFIRPEQGGIMFKIIIPLPGE